MKKIKLFIIDFFMILMVLIIITLSALLDLGNQLSSNDIKKLEKVDFSQIHISDIIK